MSEQKSDRPDQGSGGFGGTEAAEEAVLGNPVAGETLGEDAAPGGSEAASLRDQLLRALAETENVRRRAQRERQDAEKYAVSGLARELLGVADNLRRAVESIPADARSADAQLENLAAGVEMTERQLLAAFEKHGIKRIDAMGQRFDANLHQAMFEVPATGQPAGTVVQVLQPGYIIHDRLLRPAMVGVAKDAAGAPGGNGAGAAYGGNGASSGFGLSGAKFDSRA